MATGKRYYWIKLKESFMSSDVVDFLMSQPSGANYVVLYQMLCLKTINTDGRLARTIGEVLIPYDVDKIQRDCKWFTVDTIRVALELFKRFGLIYEDIDGTLVMADHANLVGSISDYAEQKQIQRSSQKGLSAPKNAENEGSRTRNNYGSEFEEFWSAYPRRVDKGNAYKLWSARVHDGFKPSELLLAAQKYAYECAKNHTDEKYIKHPKTFLSNALPFRDYLKGDGTQEEWDGNSVPF